MTGEKLRFAHLSDPHLQILEPPNGQQLLSKRVLGWLNWSRSRRHHHRGEILKAITDDIAAAKVDVIALTGDVVNIALPNEFEVAQEWVKTLGSPEQVMFVPGNHDTYVDVDWEQSLGKLAPYMHGVRLEEKASPRAANELNDFPYIRQIGSVNFIGLNSSPSTMPGLATGEIGTEQLQRFKRLCQSLKPSDVKIVMLHHPAVPGIVPARKGLNDGKAFMNICAQENVDLVIHGHTHFPCFSSIPIDAPKKEGFAKEGSEGIPHIGVASASYAGKGEKPDASGYRPAAQYHLYTVEKTESGHKLSLEVRGVDLDTHQVGQIKVMDL